MADNRFEAEQQDGETMHVVTVEFAIVRDPEVPLKAELGELTRAIASLYEGEGIVEAPSGSWRVLSVGAEEPHRDLDPCFNGNPTIPGWPEEDDNG